MKLIYYVILFFSFVVFVSAVIIIQEFKEEKKLFIEYNNKIKQIGSYGFGKLLIDEEKRRNDTLIKKYILPDSRIYIYSYEYKGGMSLYYYETVKENNFVSGKLIIKETIIKKTNDLKREYYRPDSTLFASTLKINDSLGTMVTYYGERGAPLGKENNVMNVPIYLVYVLY